MAIAYQVLILHESGTSGPGMVIAAGKVDLTNDGKYNASTMTIRTDAPRPTLTYGDPDNTQYHEWNGATFDLIDKPFNVLVDSVRWGGESYYMDLIPRGLACESVGVDVSAIPPDGIVRLVGDLIEIDTALVADFTTDTSLVNRRLRLTVNAITTGGDIVITGTSLDLNTGLKTTSDTETIAVDTTTNNMYLSDKTWVEISEVDVDTNTTGIDYDLHIDGSSSFFGSNYRIKGYRLEAESKGANANFKLIMQVNKRISGDKFEVVTIEERGIDSSGSGGDEVDYVRTAGDDRSYTYSAELIPNGESYIMSQGDFDDYFTADENVILGSESEGLRIVLVGNDQVGVKDVEGFKFALIYQIIV